MQTQNNQTNIILLSISTTLALILGFVALESFLIFREAKNNSTHWIDPNTTFDSRLGWRTAFSNSIHVPGWGKVSSNSKGYRSREPKLNKKNILFLGDSVVWGYGMNDEKIFSHYMQEKFKETDYQIHNLGVSGYGIGQYYLYLKENLELFDQIEHVFVIVYAPNDLYDTRSNVAYGKRKPYFILNQGELELRNKKISKFNLRNIFSMSKVIRFSEERWPSVKKTLALVAGDETLSFEETQKVTVRLVREMQEMVESRGGKFTLVISPSIYDFFKRTSGYEWFKRFCEKLDDHCFDLTPLLLEKSEGPPAELFGDEHHYNSKGHQLVANIFAEKFLEGKEEAIS